MITLRRSDERGHFNHGWLDTYHTFSFAGYFDREQRGFRALRVINEDRVAPGQGFSPHPHENVEIITYIVSGQLEHRDSLGNGSLIKRGEIQAMTAGPGITHSEFNPSETEALHLLQIWITPNKSGLPPAYNQRAIAQGHNASGFSLMVSGNSRHDPLLINQDVELYFGILPAGAATTYNLAGERYAWLQVVKGTVQLNQVELHQGDGAKIHQEPQLEINAKTGAELLLFDLA